MPLIDGELVPLIDAAAQSRLTNDEVRIRNGVSVGVVLAAAGYPGPVTSGATIDGVDAAARIPGVTVFHAGTALKQDRLVAAGGRVLTVVGTGADYAEAIARAYDGVNRISFDGMQYRRDIGRKALAAAPAAKS
jgi:phosphoribosylamine--glycine ligase